MIQRFLDQLEIRFGRYRGIRNLMTIVVAAMAAVYVADLLLVPAFGFSLSSWLMFDRAAILRGQVWRLITFIFMPPDSSIYLILISLFFYVFLGNMLQSHWGILRFNVFYFTGVVGNIIAGFITGYATSYYLNLSLFLALALLYPNMKMNLYGILSIEAKWLALLDILLMLPALIAGSMSDRLAVVVSLVNVILFFYDKFLNLFAESKRRREWKQAWKR